MDIPQQTHYAVTMYLHFRVPIEHDEKREVDEVFSNLCDELEVLLDESEAMKDLEKYDVEYHGLMIDGINTWTDDDDDDD